HGFSGGSRESADSRDGESGLGAALASGPRSDDPDFRAFGQRRHGRNRRVARRPLLPAAGEGAYAAIRVDLRRVRASPRRLWFTGRTEDRVRAAGQPAAVARERVFVPAARLGSVVVRGTSVWASEHDRAADAGIEAVRG